MKTFKIKYLDINKNILKTRIVKGKSKFEVEQDAGNDTKTVNGQSLPDVFMPNDTFFIQVIEMN